MEDNVEFQVFKLALTDPGAVTYLHENLPAEMVGIPNGNTGVHEVYCNILDFYNRTGLDPVDPIALQAWLAESDLSAAMGGDAMVASYIATILAIEEVGTTAGLVAVLRFRANKRKQIDSLQELQQLIGRKDYKSAEDLLRITQLTEHIRDLENEIGYDPLSTVTTAHQIAARVDEIWDLPDFLPTQFTELNKALGYTENSGFCKGAVHAIIAQSGQGKSTFAKMLTNHWANKGYTTLFVNYEEARAHWERILMTQVTGKNVYEGATAEEQKLYGEEFKHKLNEWGDRFMVRHDPDTPYFDDLEKWLRDVIGHGERVPDVVVIDTIQSMFVKGSGGKPRWGQFEEIMVRLEKLAKDMHAVFIITAQENSNRMKESREVVQMSDAGGSLTIIQKSSVAIFITQKKLAGDDDSLDECIMELQIPKNRITGKTFSKKPPLVRYNDSTKSYEPFHLVDESRYEGQSIELYSEEPIHI